jgi:diaminohydroxyphosphoribosylaminopyrimidine deaminase/5-amino-6-(5-phosphoribosylamino)uracil reductase
MTCIFLTEQCLRWSSHQRKKINFRVEFITLDYTRYPPQILTALYKKKIESLFVEGGSQLLQSFIDSGLWDEIYIEKSRKQLGSGVKSPEIDERISHSVDKKFGIPIWHFIRNRQQTQKKDDL